MLVEVSTWIPSQSSSSPPSVFPVRWLDALTTMALLNMTLAVFTDPEVANNDVVLVDNLEATPRNLSRRADADDGLVVGYSHLRPFGRDVDLARHLDDILSLRACVLCKVCLVVNSHHGATVAASGAAVQGGKPIGVILAPSPGDAGKAKE